MRGPWGSRPPPHSKAKGREFMAKFLIEWGIHDGPMLRDVVEAENVEIAEMQAYDLAVDLWESNKIHTAKPFKDTHEQSAINDLHGIGGVCHLDTAGRDLGGGSSGAPVKP